MDKSKSYLRSTIEGSFVGLANWLVTSHFSPAKTSDLRLQAISIFALSFFRTTSFFKKIQDKHNRLTPLLPYLFVAGLSYLNQSSLKANLVATTVIGTGFLLCDFLSAFLDRPQTPSNSPNTSGPASSAASTAQTPNTPHIIPPAPTTTSTNLTPCMPTETQASVIPLPAPGTSKDRSLHERFALCGVDLNKHPEIALSEQDKNAIKTSRLPVATYLQQFFQVDEWGYIIGFVKNLEDIQKELRDDETKLADLFYQVANLGDASYAEDVRTALAGMDIASKPINKDGSDLVSSYVRSYSLNCKGSHNYGSLDPKIFGKKNRPGYLGLWGYHIWRGNKEYKQSAVNKHTTPQQILSYLYRLDRIRYLHEQGLLVGRVADTGEVRDFIGHRYHMGNDILSTTLWPKHMSPLQMQLFSEYGKDTVGILLDPARVGKEDFGVSFQSNAATSGSGFQKHKKRRQVDGTTSVFAQKQLLEVYDTSVSEGVSPYDLIVTPNEDHTNYDIKKKDSRGKTEDAFTLYGYGIFNKNVIYWNEQTYYRGIERDFFLGLFIKSDSDGFSEELKRLIRLQDKIRKSKSMYVPIFLFNGKTNQLEELVPDPLLLNILGLQGDVVPMLDRKSRFSKALEEAGITQEMALKMANSLSSKTETIKSLFDLQLLMFNMKDILGQIAIKKSDPHVHGFTFESVRLIDNLHLVFPTIFQTQNPDAKQKELHFTLDEVKTISQDPDLMTYLQTTLTYNLKRFLGLHISKEKITFNRAALTLFDDKDVKKQDFAKVIARALQAAMLFKIYGDDTVFVIKSLIQEIRQDIPYLGITPTGIDMILGSLEIQEILSFHKLDKKSLTSDLETKKGSNNKEIPQVPFNSQALNPFNLSLDLINQVRSFLPQFGITEKGELGLEDVLNQFIGSDPHLHNYEKAVISIVQMLFISNQTELVDKIVKNIRGRFKAFGYSADGQDLFLPKNDQLMQWIQEHIQKKVHTSEFPFPQPSKAPPIQAFGGRRGRGMISLEQQQQTYTRGRRGGAPVAQASLPENKPFKIDNQELVKEIVDRGLIPEFTAEQKAVAIDLELAVNQDLSNPAKPLWTILPAFHGNDERKPKLPYLKVQDILGVYAHHLLTGPALDKDILEKDRASFTLHAHLSLDLKMVPRLITHTLAVTTEGDEQVLRPNGLQYSRSVSVPYGGNIDYNGGNEKHYFRSNRKRHYQKPAYTGADGYTGAGGYKISDLSKVEKYDKKLLSDEERRIKRAKLLTSAYVTVSAQGGYGSERVPLDRARRVLYIQTAGAQFEKYGKGSFIYQDGTMDTNELEATDFIIKKNAQAQEKPLFPEYYDNNKIPAHSDVLPQDCSSLDDKSFDKPFVLLKDGSLFNRQAFEKAQDIYMSELVIPAISQHIQNTPFYLKAVLFGGGFFAEANQAGNLRSEVVHAMLKSYINVIQNGKIPQGSVIEFPRYGQQSEIEPALIQELLNRAADEKIDIVWTPEGDVCDFKSQTTLAGKIVDLSDFEKKAALVVLGAADAMSWSGNESCSASVEAAFANNSNLRLVMNWWANPKVLNEIKYIASSP